MKLGTTELLVLLAIVVLLFGPTQIPKLSKMFGKSIKNFRDGVSDGDEEKKTNADADTTEQ
jgi:sec-independent protein translocase protein TatA